MDRGYCAQIDLASLWEDTVSACAQEGVALTASEQMFFRGAPLDHVLKYEQQLRYRRQARMHHISQARRILC